MESTSIPARPFDPASPLHRHVVVVPSSSSFSSSLDRPSSSFCPSTSIGPFPSPLRRPPTSPTYLASHQRSLLPSHSPPKPPSSPAAQPSSPQLFQAHLRTISLVLRYLHQNLSTRSAPGVAWALEELCRLDGRVADPILDVLASLVLGEGGLRVGEYVEWVRSRVGEGMGMLRVGDGGEVGWGRWVEREVDHLLHRILDTNYPEEQKSLLDVLDSLDPETAEEVHAILFSSELHHLDDGERRIRLLELRRSYSYYPCTDRSHDDPPPDLNIDQLAALLAPL